MKKTIKCFVGLLLAAVVMTTSGAIVAHAEPAPPLTSVRITDVTADQNDRVYIEIVEVGTSRNRFVYNNNQLLQENIYEMVMLDNNHDNIIDGYIRYFDTGLTVDQIYPGLQFYVRAEYTNERQPWNTIYVSRIFTFQ